MSAIVSIQSANLVADPQLKSTTTGKAVANFRVAVNEGFGDSKKAHFFNAVAWEDLAEQIGKLSKGTKICLMGKLASREYEKDGQKRTVVEIIVSAFAVDSRSVQKTNSPATASVSGEDIPF